MNEVEIERKPRVTLKSDHELRLNTLCTYHHDVLFCDYMKCIPHLDVKGLPYADIFSL